MSLHLVVGAGPVGTAVARRLLASGETVRVVTRSGTGLDGTERVKADASDTRRLTELAEGAVAIYNCVNPPYHRWAEDWPPIANALLAAAEASGAVLAITGNLYTYGPVSAPMVEGQPDAATGTKGRVRARMWQDALAADRAGRVRAFEVRGGDYLSGQSFVSLILEPALRKGRTAWVPAALDAPHTFTNVDDVAALLIAGVQDERAWGKVWHVPSAEPVTVRELTEVTAHELGAQPKVRSLPYGALWVGGLFNPFLRELRETQHQFREPFVMDSTAAQETFGLKPTPLEESVRAALA